MTLRCRVDHGILVSLALTILAQSALADGVSGLYVGGSAGIAKIATDNTVFQTGLQNEAEGIGTLDFTSATLHDRKTAWWANAGYMAWPYLGIDASYLHFGELYNQVLGTYTPDGGVLQSVGAATRLRSEGPALGLLFRLPLVENFDLNLRLADYYGRTTLTNIFNSSIYTTVVQTSNRSSLLGGLGASYTFFGHWSARLDYLRVEKAGDNATVGKYNINFLSAGASYTF